MSCFSDLAGFTPSLVPEALDASHLLIRNLVLYLKAHQIRGRRRLHTHASDDLILEKTTWFATVSRGLLPSGLT